MQVISFLAVDESGLVIVNSKLATIGYDKDGVNTTIAKAQAHFASSVLAAAEAEYSIIATTKQDAMLVYCTVTGAYIVQHALDCGDNLCNVFVHNDMLVGLDFVNAQAAATQALMCNIQQEIEGWHILKSNT